ncbi:MAG: ABC transporter ATP-binding protein [Syntrophomonadaceae bacterium]
MSIINVRNLSLRYPGQQHQVLLDVSCNFPQHEITLLLGPSGSGKSSLALCLNGIIPHMVEAECWGQVNLNDTNLLVTRGLDTALQVGVVLQDPEQQFCTLTVGDEVAFGLENMCVQRREMAERIDHALGLVGMAGWEKVMLAQLSGGQKQKIAIAAVLALDPGILVLDEPTANLDPVAAHEIFNLIKHLQRQEQKTIILIEHRLEAVISQAAHLVVLSEQGRLVAEGEPEPTAMMLARHQLWDQLYLPRATRMVTQLRGIDHLASLPLSSKEAAAVLTTKPTNREAQSEGSDEFKQISENVPGNGNKVNEPGIRPLRDLTAEPLIKVQDLYGSYRPHQEVLHGLNFFIKRGEFLAVVGANGSGKSTLARALLNLLPNGYQGSIRLEGRELKRFKHKELFHHLGMVFQNPEHQFVTDMVENELAFNMNKSIPMPSRAALLEEYLNRFGLSREKKRNPYQLSQGQKRRLSVASMLITTPQLIILDEPTYGQDYRNNNELLQLITQINRDGTAVLVITHDMELVSEHCQRVMVLNNGYLQFDGPPSKLFRQPQLLAECGLQPPPIMALTEAIQDLNPNFPDCTRIDEFCSNWQKIYARADFKGVAADV